MTHNDGELHDDDKPVGRVLSRREILTLFGGAGAAVIALGAGLRVIPLDQTVIPTGTSTALTPTGTTLPTCIVRPELTEGPYFVETILNRSDIRVEPSDDSVTDGTLLKLKVQVSDVSNGDCKPLPGAQVDVWHCDAYGVYSGVAGSPDTLFLRGYQITDEFGLAEFKTIVPGWYPGRAVHIHFKIRTDPQAERGYEFTSQWFFDPDQIETIYAEAPYRDRGLPNTPNSRDGIYRNGGEQLVLDLVPLTEDEAEEEGEPGYTAVFDIGLDLS